MMNSAIVKQEITNPAENEMQVLQIIQAALEGIDMDALTSMTPGLEQSSRQDAINSLLATKKVAISQAPGGVLRLKVNTSEQIAGTEEEQVIYGLIEESKTRGIWIKELRDGSGLNQLQLKKTLKSLETKKLVKTIKAVGTTRKCYILFNMEPDMSLTGGTFYSDQQLDSELINTLISVCGSYASSRRKHAIDENPNNIQMQREASYIRPQEIAQFITEKRVLNVPLSLEDLERILEVAVLDGTIERRADGKIRACPPRSCISPLVSVPCSVCPVVEDCRPGYVISPQSCQYMKNWLAEL
uniref:DNA-directed RNA polymerase III subunit RPC6 n=1 Tax=Caenorhabditis japonica TaxID=281687 RepID=A0A8R1DG55_CAEJA